VVVEASAHDLGEVDVGDLAGDVDALADQTASVEAPARGIRRSPSFGGHARHSSSS
jgi:hypothetical protein